MIKEHLSWEAITWGLRSRRGEHPKDKGYLTSRNKILTVIGAVIIQPKWRNSHHGMVLANKEFQFMKQGWSYTYFVIYTYVNMYLFLHVLVGLHV